MNSIEEFVDSECLRLSLRYLAKEWLQLIAKSTVYCLLETVDFIPAGNSVYLLLFSSWDFRQDTGNLAINYFCSLISAKYLKLNLSLMVCSHLSAFSPFY